MLAADMENRPEARSIAPLNGGVGGGWTASAVLWYTLMLFIIHPVLILKTLQECEATESHSCSRG